MGTVVMSSAMFDDLVGWIFFSMILGMMNGGAHVDGRSETDDCSGVGFRVLALTVVRWLIDKFLPRIQAHTSWPGGVLGFIFTLTLAGGRLRRICRHSRSFRRVHHRALRSANQRTCESARRS